MLPRVTVGDSVPCGWPCDRAQAGNQPKPVILSGPPSGTNEGGNGAAPRPCVQRTCSTPCARPAAPTREEMERPLGLACSTPCAGDPPGDPPQGTTTCRSHHSRVTSASLTQVTCLPSQLRAFSPHGVTVTLTVSWPRQGRAASNRSRVT